MIDRPVRPSKFHLGALLLVSAGAIAFACEAPAPADPLTLETREDVAEATGAAAAAAVEAMEDTPYTTAPRIANPDELEELVRTGYPPLLREAGIGGVAEVWFHVAKDGRVTDMQLKERSGSEALDAAAMKVAAGIRFDPASDNGEPVPVWVSIPIRFGGPPSPSGGFEREAGSEVPPPPAEGEEWDPASRAPEQTERSNLAAAPQFTPYSTAPSLQNRAEVQGLLQTEYPPLLRDAGVGGGADVWFFIDEAGAVQEIRLKASSGYPALDQAALRVAEQMEFGAAQNRDKPVPVWVSLKIEFTTR